MAPLMNGLVAYGTALPWFFQSGNRVRHQRHPPDEWSPHGSVGAAGLMQEAVGTDGCVPG